VLTHLDVPIGSSGSWVLTESEDWPGDNSSEWPEPATQVGCQNKIERLLRIHGQIVADDAFGDVYMVPVVDILEDIRQELNAREVRLPESNFELQELLSSVAKDLEDSAIVSNYHAPATMKNSNSSSSIKRTASVMESKKCLRCNATVYAEASCSSSSHKFARTFKSAQGASPTQHPHSNEVFTPPKLLSDLQWLRWFPPIEIWETGPYKRDPYIWYCVDCKDGPHPTWQISCANCGSTRMDHRV
jgi:hypothetical protein